MSLSTYDERIPVVYGDYIDDADGTGTITLYECPENRTTRIDAILASNDDIIPHVVNLLVGSNEQAVLASVSVPVGAGAVGAPPVDLLLGPNLTNAPGLLLVSQQQLSAAVEVAVGSGARVRLLILGGWL
jgi:hypothetical protein